MLHVVTIDWEKENRPLIYVPLSTSYEAPSYSFFDPLQENNINLKAAELIQASMHNSLPPIWVNKKILSGMNLFHLITDQEKYYPAQADRIIVNAEENRPYFSELFKDKILVELCAGDMRKTVDWLRGLPQDSWPEEIYINDIVGDNIKIARAKLRRMGYSGKIVPLSGDIQQEVLWNDLATGLNGREAVVLMQGATFNDFLSQNQGAVPFLKHFSKLPMGTPFVFSADNTTHHQTLHEAYAENLPLRHFLLGGAAYHFDKNFKFIKILEPQSRPKSPVPATFLDRFFEISCQYSIAGATASVSIEKDSDPLDDSKYVFMTVGRKGFQGLQDYLGIIDPITKPAKSQMAKQFAESNHALLRRFPLRWPKFPDANYAIYVTQYTP